MKPGNDLRLDRWFAACRRWRPLGLRADQAEAPRQPMREALRAIAGVDHRTFEQIHGRRIARVEQRHRDSVTGLNFFLPSLRSRLRIAIDTSPKSMSTGQGFTHLWQTVQWSATSASFRPSA